MNDTPNDGRLAELSAELESARRYAHAAMTETEALRKTIVTLADDSRMDYLLDRLAELEATLARSKAGPTAEERAIADAKVVLASAATAEPGSDRAS